MRIHSDVLRFATLACAFGCNSILGVEELGSGEAAPGSTGGGALSDGSAGGSGGAQDGSAGAPFDAPQTDAPGAAPDGSDAATSPPDAQPDTGPFTVVGHIIDSWRFPLAGVQVVSGSSTIATDQTGKFELPNVTAPYDVRFYVPAPVGEGWVFEGLTTPTPTLQIDEESNTRSQSVHFTLAGESFSNSATAALLSFGSVDGVYSEYEHTSNDVTYSMGWSGPATTKPGTFHLLRLDNSASGQNVDRYTGYQSLPGSLTDGGAELPLVYNLTGAATIPNAMLNVDVTGSPDSVSVYVHFDANAVVRVIDDWSPAASKTYNVPKQAGWTYSVRAYKGAWNNWPIAMDRKQGLSGDPIQATLAVPAPAIPGTPLPNAVGVSADSVFSWTGPSGVNILKLNMASDSILLRVVTARKSVPVPTFPPAIPVAIPKSALGYWFVVVHAPFASTDEAASPKGYADPFHYGGSRIAPEDRDGTHSFSQTQDFTTAP